MSFGEVRLEIKTCVPFYSGIASIVSILTIVNVVSMWHARPRVTCDTRAPG